MKKLVPPRRWGDDKITEFLDMARENSFATFEQMPKDFKRLIEINKLFSSALEYLEYSKYPLEVLFFQKAYSSFLGAIRLAVASQVPEAFAVLRVALESSLYGLFIFEDSNYPDLAMIWLNRHNSPQALQQARRKFQIDNMWPELASRDSQLHGHVKAMYARTIDYGAHPNEMSLVSTLRQETDPEKIRIYSRFLTDDVTFIGLGLKSSVQVGVLCLRMFKLIFPVRFEIAGLPKKLDAVSSDL